MIKKKRILKYCSIALSVLIIISLFVKSPPKYYKKKKNVSLTTMTTKKSGCMTLEENDFFKKYTINCLNELKQINYQDTEKEFIVTLNKSDLPNVDITNLGKVNSSEVKATVNSSNYILTFKKAFKNENYIRINNETNKDIVVYISKKENPYKYKVEIDPGHGGNDPGTTYGNLYEKSITLKIALFMEMYFRFNGCEPLYTRATDSTVDIHQIPDMTKNLNPDVFVSVHINSNNDKNCNGITTYYYKPDDSSGTEQMNLAKSIQSEIIKSDNWKDLGIKKNNYLVIRKNTMPSVLIECGFMGNDNDRANLSKDISLNNLAKNISNGVINYLSQKH